MKLYIEIYLRNSFVLLRVEFLNLSSIHASIVTTRNSVALTVCVIPFSGFAKSNYNFVKNYAQLWLRCVKYWDCRHILQ